MILDRIVESKRKEVEEFKNATSISDLKNIIADRPSSSRDLGQALSKTPGPNIIAEIKMASPSEGAIDPNADPAEIARSYKQGGAVALSVLTDTPFFGGSYDVLAKARSAVDLPILNKDFFIDEIQIYRAAASGADAVLLIVAILDQAQIADYLSLAHELGLNALVEVHNREEFDRAMEIKPKILGINNRNLKNMTVDLNTSIELVRDAQSDQVVVSESGIKNFQDMAMLMKAGINSFLIGTSLMKSDDREAALKKMITGEM